MARTITFDQVLVNFVEFRIDIESHEVVPRLGVTAMTPDGITMDFKLEGWAGLSSEQQTAVITGLSQFVHDRLMVELNVNPETHRLVQNGPYFQEVPK